MLFARVQPVNDCDQPDFGCAEHLLLWACRRCRSDDPPSLDMAGEFLDACGENGFDVLLALDLFVQAMAATKQLQPRFGMPGAHDLTEAERTVVTLLAACQADRFDIAEPCLDCLVDPECRSFVLMAASALAKAFVLNGLELHVPAPGSLRRCPQASIAS